ncbi:hypothetical protein ABK905_21435 [Acerihabitans sp. KWT182]|uniref:Uncharacterized protein n=1 Tax=Acerihabitans sp. KWT182 TaxID=3157919 RepID=A0AAU7Q7Z6_9GAMM
MLSRLFTRRPGRAREKAGIFRYGIQSLSARLWFISVAALALGLPIITAIVLFVFNQFPELMWQRDQDMKAAHDVASGLVFDASGRPVSIAFKPQTAWLMNTAASEILYRICDQAGHTLLLSPPRAAFRPAGQSTSGRRVDPARKGDHRRATVRPGDAGR